MRILHVTDAYLPRLGGIEMHVRDLATAQAAAGDEADIITLTTARGAAAVDIDVPATSTVFRPRDGVSYPGKTRFLARHRGHGAQQGYDVVHAHVSTISPLSFFAMATPGVPRVMTVHSLWERYKPLYRAFDRALDWSTWPVKWSAVSQVAADQLRDSAVSDIEVSVLPNGIDLGLWTPGLRISEPGHLRILAVMRLSTRKRPLSLVRMLRAVRAQVPADIKITATIIGDGPTRYQVEHYLALHRMTDWVHLTGHLPRSEVKLAMASSDVFVAPAKLESFGIAALEAHAAGLPVVGRAGNGLSEFIRDGEGGVLVDSDREMARVLARMATERTHESVPPSSSLQSFSWPAVVQTHRDLYEKACADLPRPRGTRA
jgi:phosphatidylinositol alpha 1,6-mannosyltransferase